MLFNIDSHEAYCYTGGKPFDPVLPTVVFIHGAQNDHSVWILQTRYFAHHGYGVLALDLPGHGRSKGAALTSVEAMADWLLRVLDAAGVRQASLIGHSMGSLIALETQAKAPERVTKLALIGTAYPMKVSDTLLNAALNDEQTAIDMVNIWSHSSIAQKPSFPGPGFYVTGGGRRLMQHISRHSSEKVFHIDFSACNAYANGEAAAQAATCPTLFMLGKRDQMTPPKATATLTKAMPQARVVQLEQCGHALMAEQPDAVLDNLHRFLTI
jgi:pimeloyl-ACP methyl ester carboxylesterase